MLPPADGAGGADLTLGADLSNFFFGSVAAAVVEDLDVVESTEGCAFLCVAVVLSTVVFAPQTLPTNDFAAPKKPRRLFAGGGANGIRPSV
jgi:hypothetical protein